MRYWGCRASTSRDSDCQDARDDEALGCHYVDWLPTLQFQSRWIRPPCDPAGARGMPVVFVSRDYVPDVQRRNLRSLLGLVISEPTYRTDDTVQLFYVLQTLVIFTVRHRRGGGIRST